MQIETGSTTWQAVVQYAHARLAELTEVAMTPTATEAARLAAAIRGDELRLLLGHPQDLARQALAAEPAARTTY